MGVMALDEIEMDVAVDDMRCFCHRNKIRFALT
jgi:hypothetical protein